MQTGPDVLDTVENESGSAKHENGTQPPRYRRKWVWVRKTCKRDPTSSVPSKMSLGAQNLKTGLGALGTVKTSLVVQNMKTGPDALGTAQNGFGSTKYETVTRRPRYRPKWIRECKTCKRDPTPSKPSKTSPGVQNMQTRPDVLGTIENESGSAKHENRTRRPRYNRKWVWERKIWKRDLTPSVPPQMIPGEQNMKTGPCVLGTAPNGFGSAKQ
jgi:hypothetical protein